MNQSGDTFQDSRFSGSVRADDADNFTFIDMQRDIVNDLDVAVVDINISDIK